MRIREADVADARAVSDILQELVAAGQRTKSADASFALSHYLEHPHRLHCFIAFDDSGRALGFQSLKLAHDGNPYATPVGWGIIGTHVRPSAARLGVGSGLFAATLSAVRSASLPAIEAYIGKQNHAALAYYESLGFRTYRETDGVICKAFQLLRSSAA